MATVLLTLVSSFAYPTALTVPSSDGLSYRQATPALVADYRGTVAAAAARHNRLPVSDREFARLIEQILTVEMGGADCAGQWLCSGVWYGFLSWFQAAGNETGGGNGSVGVAQLRPETARQLDQGWIEHGGDIIWHGVELRWSAVDESGAVSSWRLMDPRISIEHLAANLEMGAAVARYYGVEPTLEDLARWHNTGVGRWSDLSVRGPVWEKGSRYVDRVRDDPAETAPVSRGGRAFIIVDGGSDGRSES